MSDELKVLRAFYEAVGAELDNWVEGSSIRVLNRAHAMLRCAVSVGSEVRYECAYEKGPHVFRPDWNTYTNKHEERCFCGLRKQDHECVWIIRETFTKAVCETCERPMPDGLRGGCYMGREHVWMKSGDCVYCDRRRVEGFNPIEDCWRGAATCQQTGEPHLWTKGRLDRCGWCGMESSADTVAEDPAVPRRYSKDGEPRCEHRWIPKDHADGDYCELCDDER